jgi:FdhD protein
MSASPLGPVPGLGYSSSVSRHEVIRLSEQTSTVGDAAIADEVPVAFVYNTDSFVVVMASPADLEDLAVGFSLTEGIVDHGVDVEGIEIVRHSKGIELQMTIPPAAFGRLGARRRALDMRTGCGICGIEAIDEVLKQPPQIPGGMTFTHEALWRAAA